MNQPLDLRLDKTEFLRWVEGQPGRYELVRGRVVMMTGGSRNHARVISALSTALSNRLDPDKWSVTVADLAIDVGEGIRYPDVMVEQLDRPGSERSTDEPVLACEVLSPSSFETDFEVKPTEYSSLPSLRYYLVAAQDQPKVWLWRRLPEGGFTKHPEEYEGRDAVVDLAFFGVRVPLAEVYRSVRPA